MEVEEYLGKSRLYRRLRSGPHGQLVERYAIRLVEERLVRLGTWRCLNVVGGLLNWIAGRRCERPPARLPRGTLNDQTMPNGMELRCTRSTMPA
jgi:hypothetical protein